MDAWVVWIVLAVILAAGEMLTTSLFLAPFAAGALFGALADAAGLPDAAAIAIFLVTSGALFTFVRPIARRHVYTPPQIRTGTDALVGTTAMVTEAIANDADCGAVKLGGEIWTARAYEDVAIDAGRRVRVIEIRGATALVSEE